MPNIAATISSAALRTSASEGAASLRARYCARLRDVAFTQCLVKASIRSRSIAGARSSS